MSVVCICRSFAFVVRVQPYQYRVGCTFVRPNRRGDTHIRRCCIRACLHRTVRAPRTRGRFDYAGRVDVVDLAQRDLARGAHVEARDRLFAALRDHPSSQPVLELLGYSHLLVGDRAAAGAAWFLTDMADGDPTASAAFAALELRYPAPITLARALPINAPSASYPPRARQRLERLVDAVARSGQSWVPPRDTVYFDQDGVDADDFVDEDPLAPSQAAARSFRQRVVAWTIIVAIGLTSASVVLALVFG